MRVPALLAIGLLVSPSTKLPLDFRQVPTPPSLGGGLAGLAQFDGDSVTILVSYDNGCQLPVPTGDLSEQGDTVIARVTITELPDSLACLGAYIPTLYQARAPRAPRWRHVVLRVSGSRSHRLFTVGRPAGI
jgi:hypothetical protein